MRRNERHSSALYAYTHTIEWRLSVYYSSFDYNIDFFAVDFVLLHIALALRLFIACTRQTCCEREREREHKQPINQMHHIAHEFDIFACAIHQRHRYFHNSIQWKCDTIFNMLKCDKKKTHTHTRNSNFVPDKQFIFVFRLIRINFAKQHRNYVLAISNGRQSNPTRIAHAEWERKEAKWRRSQKTKK